MRNCRLPGMNKLRDCFKTSEELCELINRSKPYVLDRLNLKKQFTAREKRIILNHLGEGYTDDIFN